ncbi:MAG: hypothetical protein NTW79_03995 [Candidatus Berkelbacteria bacterium]|nr:hypothetical protein [Candidatus Berkelbacteria bacterium]
MSRPKTDGSATSGSVLCAGKTTANHAIPKISTGKNDVVTDAVNPSVLSVSDRKPMGRRNPPQPQFDQNLPICYLIYSMSKEKRLFQKPRGTRDILPEE